MDTGVADETLPASSLPYELLTLIFKRLELSELYNCHLVCKGEPLRPVTGSPWGVADAYLSFCFIDSMAPGRPG